MATQADQGCSIVGSFVWVEDPEEAWMDGEVVEVNGEDITVNCASGKTVISSMKILTDDSNDDDSNSFLLNDNYSSIPFSADDLSSSLHERDFSDVKPAADLLENPAFHFLQD